MGYLSSGWRPWVLAFGIYVLWCVGLAYGGGRDLNWDTLNYHLYVPSLIHRPLDQDFMAASMQSYLNPVSLLPFYWMVNAGWSALAMMLVLAVLHSLNLLLLHVITNALLPATMPWRWAFSVAGALLGGSAALFWTEIGTSFNDVICSLPVLAAIACYVVSPLTRRTGWATGALMGVAIGLKLTALPWFVAMGLVLLLGSPARWAQVWRYGCGALLGFLLVDGIWAARLFHEFGNPFFPFFNELFKSPLSPLEPLVHRRFMPDSLGALWTFPWRVALAGPLVYTETLAVDFRPAMLVLIGAALLAKALVDRRSRATWQGQGWTLLMLLAGLLAYYVCWILLSGNGRYAIAWLLMLGPVIVACWVRLMHGIRWATYGLLAMVGLQVSSNAVGAVERWASTPWPAQWMSPRVPADWRASPHLFLSLQQQSYSFLSHFVHQDSGFVNLVGQVPVRRDGREWERVAALLRQHAGRVRTLMAPMAIGAHLQPAGQDVEQQRATLLAYGLTIVQGSCLAVVIDPLADHPAVRHPNVSWAGLTDAGLVVSCAVRAMNDQERILAQADAERLQLADKVFDDIEGQCPSLTGNRSSVTTFNGHSYGRFYVNTDVYLLLRAQDGRIKFRGYDRRAQDVPVRCQNGAALAEFTQASLAQQARKD